VRIATLNPTGSAADWDTKLDASFDKANQVFNPHRIEIVQGHRDDLDATRTRNILRMLEDRFIRESGGPRLSAPATFRLDDVEGTTFPLTEEVVALLAENRGRRHEVCSYWVPNATAFGKCYHRREYRGLRNEGVYVRRNSPEVTLAHELGHLLMRCYHVSDHRNLMYAEARDFAANELTRRQRMRCRLSRYCRYHRRR